MSTASPATEGPWTVRRVLEWTTGYLKEHGSETPRLDAEVLLAHACNCPRIKLYTSYDDPLPDSIRGRMREMVKRRAAFEPVAYLVGHREFFSLDFRVTPDVLIPRPDSETLVVEALELLKHRESPRVLDIGTGSGCLAIALAVHCPTSTVAAIDTSRAALDVARANAERHGVTDRIRCLHGDLFGPLDSGETFDLIVSNPPYVRTDEFEQLEPSVRLHEPRTALVGGSDGLDVFRRIIAESGSRLAAGGSLLLECSPEQASALCELFGDVPQWDKPRVLSDLSGAARVVAARCKAG